MDSRSDLETTDPRGWAERRAFSMMDDNTEPKAKARKGRGKARVCKRAFLNARTRGQKNIRGLKSAPFTLLAQDLAAYYYYDIIPSEEILRGLQTLMLPSYRPLLPHNDSGATKTIPSNGEGGRRCETVEVEERERQRRRRR